MQNIIQTAKTVLNMKLVWILILYILQKAFMTETQILKC